MASRSSSFSITAVVLPACVLAFGIYSARECKSYLKRWLMARSKDQKAFQVPTCVSEGDKVAVLACSAGVAALFPWVRDQGLGRIISEFGLEPVVFPSMYKITSTPKERAIELERAFSDPDIRGIICSIGGDDLFRVLKYLDANVIRKNPKCVFGYSDITGLHLLMWRCGIISYYGANLMSQFGISGSKMHEFTAASIKQAAMNRTREVLVPSKTFQDGYLEWSEQSNILKPGAMEINTEGWVWHDWEEDITSGMACTFVRGRLWGGCLESLYKLVSMDIQIPSPDDLDGAVLFLETSEQMPPSGIVYDFLSTLGVKNILKRFRAILIGRPKTMDRGLVPPVGRKQYVLDQREAVIRSLREHCSDSLPIVVFNMDFGHTDPQTIVPMGGIAEINTEEKSIIFDYIGIEPKR